MTTGLSLERLAQVIHADKQRTFTQECFVHQVELAQSHAHQANSRATWQEKISAVSARQCIISVAIRPFRLTVQWS